MTQWKSRSERSTPAERKMVLGVALSCCAAAGAASWLGFSVASAIAPAPSTSLVAAVAESPKTTRSPATSFAKRRLAPRRNDDLAWFDEVSPTTARALPTRDRSEPAPAGPQPTDERPEVDRFAVQVASLDSKTAAETAVSELIRAGHPAFLTVYEIPSGTRFHRVRVGPFEGREEAERYRARLVQDRYSDALILRQEGSEATIPSGRERIAREETRDVASGPLESMRREPVSQSDQKPAATPNGEVPESTPIRAL